MRVSNGSLAEEECHDNPSEHTSIVKKTPGKEEYCVKSEKNPDWSGGCYKSKEKANNRLKQVEMFKHMGSAVASTFDYMNSFFNVQQQSVPMDRDNIDIIWNNIKYANNVIDAIENSDFEKVI